jgi:hypothetical protein
VIDRFPNKLLELKGNILRSFMNFQHVFFENLPLIQTKEPSDFELAHFREYNKI